MADRFVLCPSCSRHAKVHEVRCPFCGEDLDAARPSKGDPYRRMAAAAAVAAGVATLTGCSSSTSHTAFYGAPGINGPQDGSGGTGDDGAADAPAPVPFYGLANPMPDAAGDAGVGAESGDGPEPTDGSGDALG